MLHPVLLPHITVLTGRVQRITEVRAAAVLQELIVHRQPLPNREVFTEVLPQEAAAAVTAAVAHPLHGAIHPAAQVAQEAAGHPLHHRQEEEDKPDVGHNF